MCIYIYIFIIHTPTHILPYIPHQMGTIRCNEANKIKNTIRHLKMVKSLIWTLEEYALFKKDFFLVFQVEPLDYSKSVD